jgi:hypothetical protein
MHLQIVIAQQCCYPLISDAGVQGTSGAGDPGCTLELSRASDTAV